MALQRIPGGSLMWHDRNVSFLDPVGIELRYSTFTAADAVRIQNYNWQLFGSGSSHWPSANLFATSWQQNGFIPNVLFEFSDGTFGCFAGSHPASGNSAVTVNTGTTPDEVALKFRVPFACSIGGAEALMGSVGSTTADFDLVLYDSGGSVLASKSYDGAWRVTNERRNYLLSLPETDIDPNTDYYLTIKPTTASNVQIGYWTVAASGHRAVWPGGTNGVYSSRTDAGAWSDTDTRIPEIYPRFSRFDDGAGGSGAGGVRVAGRGGLASAA